MQREAKAGDPADEVAEPAAATAAMLSPQARILALQRTAGNRAVTQLLARREKVNPTWSAAPSLEQGDWLDTDRTRNTDTWKKANEHNLVRGDSDQYTEIAQRRDFYRWFYIASTEKGHETRWALAASIVAAGAGEISTISNGSQGVLGAGTNELQGMMREGNQVIFDNVFPKLRALWLGPPLKGQAAIDWDANTLAEEQNLIQPLYGSASPAARKLLEGIAKGDLLTKAGAVFSDADEVRPGTNIAPGPVPYFPEAGDLQDIGQRWQYGMKLAADFSKLKPAGTVPAGPGAVDAGYRDGSELRKVDTRRNLHFLDALIDSTPNTAERAETINRLKLFTPEEQKRFLDDPSYPERLARIGMQPESMLAGMSGWTHSLGLQLIFVHKLPLNNWKRIEYSMVKDMIKAASPQERRAISGEFWRGVFTQICNDKTIVDAVNDLGLAEPERSTWIEKELAWF